MYQMQTLHNLKDRVLSFPSDENLNTNAEKCSHQNFCLDKTKTYGYIPYVLILLALLS